MTSIYPTQMPYNPAPVSNQTYRPRQGVFYALDMNLSAPPSPERSAKLRLRDWAFHPIETYYLMQQLKISPQKNESFGMRLAMYRVLKQTLSTKGRKNLYQQLIQGRLTDVKADDNRSTLSHLYAIVTTPRAEGLEAKLVLEDILRLMSAPQTITQRFGKLQPQFLQGLMNYYNSGSGPKISQPIDINSLRVSSSATCVASSLMYYMVSKNPSEFARHIAELTSPRLAFQEKAWLNEISPEDPSQAAQKLAEYGIPAVAVPGTNGAQYWVKVDLPYSGLFRAMNHEGSHEIGTRGVVEAAYQSALTHLVVRSYDPGLDMRVNPDGTLDPSKGLEEDRKTLMESIIKDNGGVMSVTYQFTAAGSDDEPYLMGYYRNFDQTTRDVMQAIDNGEQVIIGITDTDRLGTPGRINMGHELTVTGYEQDKKTGEIMFTIADSDDDDPNLVKRPASEIVPQIHHAGFPVKQAQKIWNEINSRLNDQYMVPDQADQARYHLISMVPVNKQKAFLEEYQRKLQQEEAGANQNQAITQPAQQQHYYQPMPFVPYPQYTQVRNPFQMTMPYTPAHPYASQWSHYAYPTASVWQNPYQSYVYSANRGLPQMPQRAA